MQAWNLMRKQILDEALEVRLLPALASEVQARLVAEARDAALRKAADALWAHATRGPLQACLTAQPSSSQTFQFPGICLGNTADCHSVHGNDKQSPRCQLLFILTCAQCALTSHIGLNAAVLIDYNLILVLAVLSGATELKFQSLDIY